MARYVYQLTSEQISICYIKSSLKMLIVTLLAIEALRLHLFLTIAILFAAYFTMPSKYTADKPYKAAEAWMKTIFGLIISILLFVALSPGTSALSVIFGSLGIIIAGIVIAFAVGVMTIKLDKWWKSVPLTFLICALGYGSVVAFLGQYTPPAISIFFLSMAFFFVTPKKEKRKEGEEEVVINLAVGPKMKRITDFAGGISGFYGEEDVENAGKGFFLALVFMAATSVMSWTQGSQDLAMLMFIILAFSLLTGYSGGKEGRPAIGVIMIFFAIVAFSFQFTGTVGVALFGQYWPAVYNTGTMIIDPMTSAMGSVSGSIGDAWLAVSCPSCYQAEMERRRQLESGLKSGGTEKALELTGFEALNYMTQDMRLDPSIPLVGYIELQNQGEFVANNVVIAINKPVILDPTKVGGADEDRWQITLTDDNCIFTECTATSITGSGSMCEWKTTPSRPQDVKIMNFKCGKPSAYSSWAEGNENSPNNLRYCECHDQETGTLIGDAANCKVGSGCNGKYKLVLEEAKTYNCGSDGSKCLLTFKKAGWAVRVPFAYDFSYTVNASLDVEIMNKDLFIRKLLNKEFIGSWQSTGFISQYSGGPVTLAIYTQKQPLRDNESINCRVGIMNNGEGTVEKGATVKLRIPKSSGITMSETPKEVSTTRMSKCTWTDTNEYKEATCTLSSDLKSGESATYLFSYKFKLDPNIPVKDLLYVGDASYKYLTKGYVTTTLADSPVQ